MSFKIRANNARRKKGRRPILCSRHERDGRAKEWGLKIRQKARARGPPSLPPSFNSLTKDGLINKSITHTRGAGGMNAYRVDKDRGEDVDKIGGCPRVLVVDQRGARHGINVWPPRQNIHAGSSVPAVPSPLNRQPGPVVLPRSSLPRTSDDRRAGQSREIVRESFWIIDWQRVAGSYFAESSSSIFRNE